MSDFCVNQVENHWKVLTKTANELFNNEDYKLALTIYKNALYKAEVLNNHILDCLRLKVPFLQIYIISCNNIANSYEELDNLDEAKKMLKRVIHYILHLANNKELNTDELQSELKRATVTYASFTEKLNLDIDQEELFKKLNHLKTDK